MKILSINSSSLIIVSILAIILCTSLCVTNHGSGQIPAVTQPTSNINESIKNGTNYNINVSQGARLAVKEIEVSNGTIHKLVLVERKPSNVTVTAGELKNST